MHLIKNIAEHIVKVLSGSADSHKVREEERLRKRFRVSWVESDGSQRHLPPAPFRLQKDELKVANERAVSIKVPFRFDWKPQMPQMIFQQKSFGMKSHEWKQVIASGILKFCIRGLLGKKQRTTLLELCDVIAQLCSEQVSLLELDAIESKVHRVLALLERDFPVSLHVVTFHLLHHLPMFLRRFGPVYGYWMYPMERFNSWMTRRALNRRFPESTIMETYRLYEFAHFLQISGQLPTGALTEPTIADEDLAQSSSVAVLEASDLQYLDEYYQKTVPEYHHLTVRYAKERRRAQIMRKLKTFPIFGEWTPKEGPPLTPKEERMRQGPSSEVVKRNFFTFEDKHKRLVRLSSEQSDNPTSNSVSSYVYVHHTDILFGRVRFIFEHTFSDDTSTLAFVHWFDGHTVDFESKLIHVSLDTHSSHCPVVSIDQLSKPLLTASDTREPHKLWILNFL